MAKFEMFQARKKKALLAWLNTTEFEEPLSSVEALADGRALYNIVRFFKPELPEIDATDVDTRYVNVKEFINDFHKISSNDYLCYEECQSSNELELLKLCVLLLSAYAQCLTPEHERLKALMVMPHDIQEDIKDCIECTLSESDTLQALKTDFCAVLLEKPEETTTKKTPRRHCCLNAPPVERKLCYSTKKTPAQRTPGIALRNGNKDSPLKLFLESPYVMTRTTFKKKEREATRLRVILESEQNRICDLQNQVSFLSAKLAGKEKTESQLRKIIDDFRAREESNFDCSEKQHEELQKKIESLKVKASAANELEEEHRQLKEDNEKLSALVEDLEEKISQLRSGLTSNADLSKELRLKQDEIACCHLQISQVQEENRVLEKTITDLQNELAVTSALLESARKARTMSEELSLGESPPALLTPVKSLSLELAEIKIEDLSKELEEAKMLKEFVIDELEKEKQSHQLWTTRYMDNLNNQITELKTLHDQVNALGCEIQRFSDTAFMPIATLVSDNLPSSDVDPESMIVLFNQFAANTEQLVNKLCEKQLRIQNEIMASCSAQNMQEDKILNDIQPQLDSLVNALNAKDEELKLLKEEKASLEAEVEKANLNLQLCNINHLQQQMDILNDKISNVNGLKDELKMLTNQVNQLATLTTSEIVTILQENDSINASVDKEFGALFNDFAKRTEQVMNSFWKRQDEVQNELKETCCAFGLKEQQMLDEMKGLLNELVDLVLSKDEELKQTYMALERSETELKEEKINQQIRYTNYLHKHLDVLKEKMSEIEEMKAELNVIASQSNQLANVSTSEIVTILRENVSSSALVDKEFGALFNGFSKWTEEVMNSFWKKQNEVHNELKKTCCAFGLQEQQMLDEMKGLLNELVDFVLSKDKELEQTYMALERSETELKEEKINQQIQYTNYLHKHLNVLKEKMSEIEEMKAELNVIASQSNQLANVSTSEIVTILQENVSSNASVDKEFGALFNGFAKRMEEVLNSFWKRQNEVHNELKETCCAFGLQEQQMLDENKGLLNELVDLVLSKDEELKETCMALERCETELKEEKINQQTQYTNYLHKHLDVLKEKMSEIEEIKAELNVIASQSGLLANVSTSEIVTFLQENALSNASVDKEFGALFIEFTKKMEQIMNLLCKRQNQVHEALVETCCASNLKEQQMLDDMKGLLIELVEKINSKDNELKLTSDAREQLETKLKEEKTNQQAQYTSYLHEHLNVLIGKMSEMEELKDELHAFKCRIDSLDTNMSEDAVSLAEDALRNTQVDCNALFEEFGKKMEQATDEICENQNRVLVEVMQDLYRHKQEEDQKLDEMQELLDGLMKTLVSKNEELEELNSKYQEANATIECLKTELETEKTNRQLENIHYLEKELKALDSEITKIKELKDDVDRLRSQIDNVTRTSEQELPTGTSITDSSSTNCDSSIVKFSENVAQIVDTLLNEHVRMQHEILGSFCLQRLKENHLLSELLELIEDCTKTVDLKNNELAEMNEKYEQVRKAKKSIEAKLAEEREDYQKKIEEATQTLMSCSTLASKAKKYKEAYSNVKKELEDVKKFSSVYESELCRAKTEMSVAARELEKSKKDLVNQKGQLDFVTRELQAKEETITTLKRQQEELETELCHLRVLRRKSNDERTLKNKVEAMKSKQLMDSSSQMELGRVVGKGCRRLSLSHPDLRSGALMHDPSSQHYGSDSYRMQNSFAVQTDHCIVDDEHMTRLSDDALLFERYPSETLHRSSLDFHSLLYPVPVGTGTCLEMAEEQGEIMNQTPIIDIKREPVSARKGNRLEELKRRNTLVPLHLKSCYPLELDTAKGIPDNEIRYSMPLTELTSNDTHSRDAHTARENTEQVMGACAASGSIKGSQALGSRDKEQEDPHHSTFRDLKQTPRKLMRAFRNSRSKK